MRRFGPAAGFGCPRAISYQFMQAAQRAEVVHAVKGGIWRVHPDLPKAVDEAISAYHSLRAPLYKLSPIRSLGYLDEEDHIVRKKNLEIFRGVLEGEFSAAVEEFLAEPMRRTCEAIGHRLVRREKTLWHLVWRLAGICSRSSSPPRPAARISTWVLTNSGTAEAHTTIGIGRSNTPK